jgi:hypothetical protein
MIASTMVNVAYGLRCDSSEDPLLIRMEKLMEAVIQAALPTQFLVVSLLLAYAYDRDTDFSSLECISGFQASSFLDAWRYFQEVDQALG